MNATIVHRGQKITIIVNKLERSVGWALIRDGQVLDKEAGYTTFVEARLDALARRRELTGI